MRELYAGYGWALDIAIAGNEPGDRFLFTFRYHGHATTFGPIAAQSGLIAIRLSGAQTETLQIGSHSGELVLLRDEGAAVIPLDTDFTVHKAGTPPILAGQNPQPLTAANGAPFTIVPQDLPGITLSLQRSVAGPAGLSAYDVAVKNGFAGTEAEWLNTIGDGTLRSRVAALEVMLNDLSGGTLVTPVAPTFVAQPTISPSIGDLGTVFTLTHGTAIGYPDPVTTGVLTLDGVDVTQEISDNTYVADSTGTLQWTVTAANTIGSNPQSVEVLVRIQGSDGPSFTTLPSISPASGDIGTVFSLSDGVATGTPAPTLSRVLTLNGANVTSQIIGGTFTATGAGPLVYTVTAENTEGTLAASAIGTVGDASRVAPSFTTLPAISPASGDVGTVFAISNGVAGGNPTPTLSGTLTLDGVDITSQMVGSSYISTAPGVLAYTVVALNSEGTDVRTASGAVTTANTGSAPSFTTLPQITPTSGDVGTVFVLSEGIASGSPAPVLTGILTLDGVDVTSQMVGSSYVSTGPGVLAYQVTAQNSVGTDVRTAGGAVTTANTGTAPSFTAQPSIVPSSGEVGTVFSLSDGAASGDPAPVLSGVLTLDGVNVTAQVSGGSYTSTVEGILAYTVTAQNTAGTDVRTATGAVTAANTGTAPSFTTQPTISPASGEVGTVFTLTDGVATGDPAPILSGTLTLDGVDVTSEISGGAYTSTATGALVWSVRALNTEGSTTQTANSTVTAATAAPEFTRLPGFSPTSGPVGTEFFFALGIATGNPTATRRGTLTLDGVDITSEMSSGRYTSTATGILEWSVTAQNSVGSVTKSKTGAVVGAPQIAAPANLYTAAQSDFTDTSHVELRNNWDFVGGALTQEAGNGSMNDARLNFATAATSGEPLLALWKSTIGNTGNYKMQFGGAGSVTGFRTRPTNLFPKSFWLPGPDVTGNFTQCKIKPEHDDFDTTFTSVEAFNLSTTDPQNVACDVILCLGDSNMANATSEMATEDNLETDFDGRMWYMPCLRVSPNAFDNTYSVRHVPQPCLEPVQASAGGLRMSPLMACAGELVNWSAARGRPVLMLSLGDAGSGLNNTEDWRKTSASGATGARMWKEMVAMIAALDALGPNHEIVGAIVSLGANDTTGAPYDTVWEPVADQFVTDLRAEVGDPSLPIAWLTPGEHFEPVDGEDRGARMIAAIERLDGTSGSPVAIPGVKACRPPNGNTLMPGVAADPHFNAAGMQANGRVLGQTLLGLLAGS